MAMQLQMEQRATYLSVRASGTYDRHEAKKSWRRALDICVEHGPTKLLIDVRPLDGGMSVMDKWDLMTFVVGLEQEYAATRGLPPVRSALIGKANIVDDQHFGETVGANRGMNYRSFLDLGQALDWLGVDPADSPDALAGR